MPLGSYPLGVGPLGFDPTAPASPSGLRQPLAPLLHPGTHDAVTLDNKLLLGVHPVDQAVALALGVERGTIASAPSQGHSLRELEHLQNDLEAQVRQRIDQALSVLISRGDIALDSVVTTRIEGGFVVDVSYRNLRLLPAAQRNVPLRG